MLRLTSVPLAMVTMLIVAITTPVAIAQTPEPTVATPLIVEPGRIEGLEQAIFRDYQWTTGDATPRPVATPDLMASPVIEPSGTYPNFWVGDFDSAEAAEQLFDATDLDQFVQYVLSIGEGTGEFETVEITETEHAVKATAGIVDFGDDLTANTAYVLMQQGDRVVLATVIDFGDGSPDALVDDVLQIATDVLTAPVGDEEPVFEPMGTSSGGLWEVLPAAGDVTGLEPISDEQLWPES